MRKYYINQTPMGGISSNIGMEKQQARRSYPTGYELPGVGENFGYSLCSLSMNFHPPTIDEVTPRPST
jgi:hypothetical protein